VPCCNSCRQTQSFDDEYFKNVVVMRQDVAAHPAGARVLDSVHRALARPQNRRFTTSLLRSVTDVEIRSLEGLYLGRGKTYTVDIQRLDRVMRRTLVGLYFHECRERLPDGHVARVLCADGFNTAPEETRSTFKVLADHALAGRPRSFGDRVFTYWFQHLSDGSGGTLWAFVVYSSVAFVGFTGPAR
jgi:hypothetical protein